MIDFTNCQINSFRAYGGANGFKLPIIYNGSTYMLKVSAKSKKTQQYTNSHISEHICSQIINSMGIKAQETLIGTFRGKPAVACKDFTDKDNLLLEFAQIKNSTIDSSENGYGTELSEIEYTFAEELYMSESKMKHFFWDLFIIDGFLGNFDRHNGNWGLLVNESMQKIDFAPIYDCGSCLYPQLPVKEMDHILNNKEEINHRIYIFPQSAIKINQEKINYFDYISSLSNPDCNSALLRIAPKINIESIFRIIDSVEMPNIQKNFYKTMLIERKEKVIDYSLEKLQSLAYEDHSYHDISHDDFEWRCKWR